MLSSPLAFMPAFIQQPSFATVLFASLITIYALLRPPMVRDEEDRPLPPSKLVRLVVVILYLGIYLALVGLFIIGGAAAADMGDQFLRETVVGTVSRFGLPDLKNNAPGLAFGTLFGAMWFQPVRQIEQRVLVWLHLGSHFGHAGKLLARHLTECSFTPTPEERQRSISDLKGYNLFFTDNNSQSIQLGSVDRWRKVHTLLRLVNEWNAGPLNTLSKEHKRRLPLLAAAHHRKTKLALGIVSLVSSSGDKAQTLSRVSEILTDAPHADPTQATEREAEIAVLLGSEAASRDATRPMSLSSHELQSYLRPINEYFNEEYELLLSEVAEIAAASLMQGGDHAGGRLESLRTAGFGGIGLLERMDIPRLILIVVAVGLAGFAILSATWPIRPETDPEIARQMAGTRMRMTGAIALIIAIAALIGAFTGSIGSLARAAVVPWSRYLLAGLIGVLAFFLVHGAQFQLFGDPRAKRMEIEAKRQEQMLATSAVRSVIEPADRALIAERNIDRKHLAKTNRPLLRVAPFALLPFCIVIGMCLMARVSTPWVPRPFSSNRLVAKIFERTIDGLAMAGMLIVAVMLSFTLATVLQTMPPPPPGAPPPNPLVFFLPFGLLGFAIGFMVLRDVRLAAHTMLVDSEVKRAGPKPASRLPPTERIIPTRA